VFDGVRRWKNGKIAHPQPGRHDRKRKLPVRAGGKVRIDLRRKEFWHLRGVAKRDWAGRLVLPDGTRTEPTKAGQKKLDKRKWKKLGPDGRPKMPTQSRAHLQANGVYVKSGKPIGRRTTGRNVGRVCVTMKVRTAVHYDLAVHARSLGVTQQRLVELAVEAFTAALASNPVARRALAASEARSGLTGGLASGRLQGSSGAQLSRGGPMNQHPNYPTPNQPTTVPASTGTQNPGAASEVGYTDNRGNAPSKAGLNYAGSPGTGVDTPKNQPKAP
jgi:hypothetical protein